MEAFFEKNKKIILAAAGVAAGAALVALLFSRNQKNMTQPLSEHSKPLTREEKAGIISSIQLEYDGEYLSDKTFQDIVEAVSRFSASQHFQLGARIRNERRAKGYSDEAYIAAETELKKGGEAIVQQSLREVLRGLKITEGEFQKKRKESHQNLESKVLFLTGITISLKGGSKSLTTEECEEIFNEQAQLINAITAGEIKRLLAKNIERDMVWWVLIRKMRDEIYKKYLLESEDLSTAEAQAGGDFGNQYRTATKNLHKKIFEMTI